MSPLMTLEQVASWLKPAQPVAWPADQALGLYRVHTDSRSLQAGDLFVALRGQHFDASHFLAQAKAAGAVAAICQGRGAGDRLRQIGLPGLLVPDSTQALAQLASCHRRRLQLGLIAVTGSNGKTTVTQMIAAILQAHLGPAYLATEGNFNNHIGLPLTVLRLRSAHQLAVCELGMNRPGEIATLAAIAQPDVALVNNAQREHLEFMHTVQAVARENGAVISALPAHGVAVFAADDAFSSLWQELAGSRPRLRFALDDPAAEVFALQAQWQGSYWQVAAQTPVGVARYRLHIAGVHNVRNSLAALACAVAAGVPLAAVNQGLSAFEPVAGRSRLLQLRQKNGRCITVVDDSYNANPDSMRAAIEVLKTLPGPHLLVLGDMAEVGSQTQQAHAQVLMYAQQQGINRVLVTGEQFALAARAYAGVEVCCQMADLQAATLAALPHVASVLIKGSRCMAMERLLTCIQLASNNEVLPC